MNKILLIGFKSSGKTTLGNLLAKKLHLPFYDLDHLLLKKNPGKSSIRELFYAVGEYKFRKQERDLFLDWQNYPSGVYSIGAGAFDVAVTPKEFTHFQMRIFIATEYETILSRLENEKGYPFIQNLEILHKKRVLLYEKICTHKIVFADDSIEDAVSKLLRLIQDGK